MSCLESTHVVSLGSVRQGKFTDKSLGSWLQFPPSLESVLSVILHPSTTCIVFALDFSTRNNSGFYHYPYRANKNLHPMYKPWKWTHPHLPTIPFWICLHFLTVQYFRQMIFYLFCFSLDRICICYLQGGQQDRCSLGHEKPALTIHNHFSNGNFFLSPQRQWSSFVYSLVYVKCQE